HPPAAAMDERVEAEHEPLHGGPPGGERSTGWLANWFGWLANYLTSGRGAKPAPQPIAVDVPPDRPRPAGALALLDQRADRRDGGLHRRPERAIVLGPHPHRDAVRHREEHVGDRVRRRVEPQDALGLLRREQP